MGNRLSELKLEIIINRKLFEKKVISYAVFQKVNDLLLSKINIHNMDR